MSTTYLAARAAILAILAAWGTPAWTQASDRDTVTVLGLRTDQTTSESGIAVTVIDADAIERRALTFAPDALAAAPGVTVVQAGAFGGVSSVRIRGNASGQTLVLIDGVAVNDAASPGGGFDFGSLELFGVERIEVLRGPQSTLWGADAIGGVVSIVTAEPGEELAWRGFAEAGSYDSLRTGASLSGGTDRVQGQIAGGWHAAEGISKADKRAGAREADAYETTYLSGRGRVKLSEAARIDATLRWSATDYAFDGFPPPAFMLADTDDRQVSEEMSGRVALTAETMGGRLQHVLEATGSEIDRETFTGPTRTSGNNGERWIYRYTGRLTLGERQKVWLGAEREETRADGESADGSAVFGLYTLDLAEGLSLSAGLRHDEADRYGSETTGRAAASWQATDAVRFRASWGQGFKPPTLFQTNFICGFCGLTAPNRDLRAETSEAADVGVDVRLGAGEVSLTVFDQSTEDLIDFDFSRGFANIALAEQRGVEAAGRTPLGRWAELNVSYAWIDAKDGDGGPLPRVPEHSGTAELVLSPEGPFTASLAVRHNDRQSDGFGPDVEAWTRADIAARYGFRSGLELYGRIENVTDEAYQQVGGYGTPGLSGVIGVRVRG